VSGAPGNPTLNSLPSGNWRPLRYNSPDRPVYAPDSPVCQRSNDCFKRNGRLQRINCTPARAEVRACAAGTPDSLQDLSGAPPDSPEAPQVRAPTVEPQRLADVAGAPDSVRCAMRQQTSNGHILVVGAINTPTTPHSIASKFLHFYTLQEL
jgi:hypothetical protein